jgi:hypothetical protein
MILVKSDRDQKTVSSVNCIGVSRSIYEYLETA